MEKKIFILVLAVIMVLVIPAYSFAREIGDMTQDQIHDQTMTQLIDQTSTELPLQIHDKVRLHDKLCIKDIAVLTEKDCLKTQDRDRIRLLDC